MAAPITITKSANADQAIVGQELLYTIQVVNTTGVVLNSVVVSDLLAPTLSFVPGSVQVNAFPMPLANISAGVEMGPMGLGMTKTLLFYATITGLPKAMLTNQSSVVYQYTDPITHQEVIETQTSNVAMVQVETAEVLCTKTTPATQVQLGETISYRVTLENTGTLEALQVVYRDVLVPSVELVPTSVTVNGVPVIDPDLAAGISVGSIAVGEETILQYSVVVVGGSCTGMISNSGSADFYYVLPNRVTGRKRSNSSSVSVAVNIVTFKQIVMNKHICVPGVKPDVEDMEDVTAEIDIDNVYVLNTVKATSNEAQKLSSYKLIVHGTVRVSFQYTAQVCDQALHSTHSKLPFSAFLVLPPDYNGQTVEVNSILEDICVTNVTQRGFEVGLAFLLIGQMK